MTTQEQNLGAVGAEADSRHKDITDRLTRIEEAVTGEGPPVPPEPPEPSGDATLSGVYTGANQNSGQAEKDFGNWRGKTVEKVLTFTPDDKWDTSWWISVFGGNFPFKDRLIITRGLCLKGESVDTPLKDPDAFKKWGTAVKNAGITNSVWRLGHEANGSWYPWKIQGHEQTWANRFEQAVRDIRSTCPDAKFNFCLAADQRTDGFRMPGADYVDEYGVDLYDLPGHIEDWSTHVDIASDYGVPLSVPEWGLWDTGGGGGGDNPDYISQMDELTARDCKNGGWEAYFNKDSSGQHKLDHYPNGKEEYLEDFGGFVSTRAQFFHVPRWVRSIPAE
jgi:hypothetical protein